MELRCEWRFFIELVKQPMGERLAREPIERALLGRLADETRYEAAARGLLPDDPEGLSARSVPLRREGDQAGLAGLRVEMWHGSDPAAVFALDFPSEIVATRGRVLGRALIDDGRLVEGDRYLIRLTAEAASGSGTGLDDQAEQLPFPVVGGGTLAALGVGPGAIAQASAERPVFVSRAVLDTAIDEAARHEHQETGTLLLGLLVEDQALRAAGCRSSWAVVVTAQAAVDDGRGTASSFVFPPESFRQARRLATARGRGERVVGTQHSHGWSCPNCAGLREVRNLFFSSDDEIMTHHFPVYAPFIVVGGDPDRGRDRPVADLFARLRGTVRSIPFGTF